MQQQQQQAGGSGTDSGGEQPPAGDDFRVSAPTISLQKGADAIRDIGEKFVANPVTGTGSMSVPIATSPDHSGFGPLSSFDAFNLSRHVRHMQMRFSPRPPQATSTGSDATAVASDHRKHCGGHRSCMGIGQHAVGKDCFDLTHRVGSIGARTGSAWARP